MNGRVLTAAGSHLVAGARQGNAMSKPHIRIVVTRPFLVGGVRQEVGSEIDVDPVVAAELVTMGKAQRVAAKAPDKQPAPRLARAQETSHAGR